MNDQCFCHVAPCSIHRVSSATCRAVSGSPADVPPWPRGIRTAGFVAVTRLIIWLLAGSPGTIAKRPPLNACLAPSSRSSRSVAICDAGPWHWKHLSDRIGRMSRLNSMVAGSESGAAGQGVPCGAACATRIRIKTHSSANAPIHPETRELRHPASKSTHESVPSESGVAW